MVEEGNYNGVSVYGGCSSVTKVSDRPMVGRRAATKVIIHGAASEN